MTRYTISKYGLDFSIRDDVIIKNSDLTYAAKMYEAFDPTIETRFKYAMRRLGKKLNEIKPDWGPITKYPYKKV